MSPFTRDCPNAKPDDAYAHDIVDSFASDGGLSEKFLYCKRCGQAVMLKDALEVTDRLVRAPVAG